MRTIFVTALLALLPLASFAETDDVGLWVGASVEKKLTKKWSIEAEGEYRMMDNLQATDRFSVGISTAYKLTKWLKADAGYDYLHSREPGEYTDGGTYYKSAYWYPRHRGHVSIAATAKLTKRLRLSLRERWVYTYRPSYDRNRINVDEASTMYGVVSSKEVKGKGRNVLRTRLALDYKPKKSRFNPYAAVELFCSAGSDEGCFGTTEKVRYSIGTEYELSKHHALKVFYLFQDYKEGDDGDGSIDRHVFGVNYGFSF